MCSVTPRWLLSFPVPSWIVSIPRVQISPITGPLRGGTTIHVQGTNLRNVSTLRCQLGNASVPARYHNESSIECASLPSSSAAADSAPLFTLKQADADRTNGECYNDLGGGDYRGYVSTTHQGLQCQNWLSQNPHSHTFTPVTHPAAGLGDHSFCRQPSHQQRMARPWCFTTDGNTRWSYCDVGRPAQVCQRRVLLHGSASFQAGALWLTKSEGESGHADILISQLLPPDRAGSAVTGLWLELDILTGAADVQERASAGQALRSLGSRQGTTFSLHYGAAIRNGGMDIGLRFRITTRGFVGQVLRPYADIIVNGAQVLHVELGARLADSFTPMMLRLTADHELTIVYADIAVVSELRLAGLQPASDWHLRLSASNGPSAAVVHAVDNVRVMDPVDQRPIGTDNVLLQAPLAISLNSNDFTVDPIIFFYTVHPVLSGCSPTTGPLAGGTRIWLQGAGLERGVDSRCRFGDREVPGSLGHGGGMVCVSPEAALPGAVPLQVTMNGQNYGSDILTFTGYATPYVSQLSLAVGPIGGGTVITLHGDNLAGGNNCRCRFGGLAHSVLGTVLDARSIMCSAPAHSAMTVFVEVSLNGQQYTHYSVPYTYAEPAIAQLSPSSGPSAGSTLIFVHGEHLINYTTHLACQFGTSEVPATVLVAGSLVLCTAPPALTAEAESTLTVDSGEDALAPSGTAMAPYSLRGSALALPDGTVRLTSNDYHLIGSLVVDNVGTASRVAHSFSASFDIYTGDGTGGEGSSFCYGHLPEQVAVGAKGIASGLCVRFRTRDASNQASGAVEVTYDGALLQTIRLKDSRSAISLRQAGWATVGIAYDAFKLQISYNGEPIFDAVQVHGWHPRDTWQFVLGASTGAWHDSHRVDNLRVRVGALVARTSVPVHIASNGARLSTSGRAFEYFPAPVVSLTTPEAGPIRGGTLILVSGAGLFDAGSLLRCRFNQTVVAASFVSHFVPAGRSTVIGDGILCRSPARAHPGIDQVSVSLNGQDFHSETAGFFQAYATPQVISLVPSSGPSEGGTHVQLHGEGLLGGRNGTRFCQFGQVGVLPLYVRTASSAVLITPRLPRGLLDPYRSGGNVSVEVSLNELNDVTSDLINFTFYAPISVSKISPPTGPVQGGSLLSVSGVFSERNAAYSCSFDNRLVPATRHASDMLLCTTVPLPPGTHAVEVTPDGDHYSADGVLFAAYQLPLVLRVSPASGPIAGGTLVTFAGHGFDAGTLRFCAFNVSLLTPATLSDDSHLLCLTPPSQPGAHAIAASLNGQQYVHSGVHFVYDADPRVSAMSPTIGPSQGNTLVVLSGNNLGGGTNALCRFGDALPVPMVPLLNSQNATCTTPPMMRAAHAGLAITLNGLRYFDTSFHFTYQPKTFIHSISPSSGPLLGQTLIRIRGGNFSSGTDLRCRFGLPHRRYPFFDVMNGDAATFDEETHELFCRTPSHGSTPPMLALEVTLNGQQFSTTSTVVDIYDQPRVSSVTPSSGPTDGGTLLHISGTFGGGVHLQCRFADLSYGRVHATVAPASLGMAPGLLLCATPAIPAPTFVTVDTALNAQQFTNDTVGFTFVEPLRISTVHPATAPVQGGAVIKVLGSGFFSTGLLCRFASTNFEATAPAAFVANDTVSCTAPATNGTSLRSTLSNVATPHVLFGDARLLHSHPTGAGAALTTSAHHSAGSWLWDVHDDFQLTVRSFELSFNVTVVVGALQAVGDGWSFSYGDFPRGLVSERGAGMGIRIQLHLRTQEITVKYHGRVLWRQV